MQDVPFKDKIADNFSKVIQQRIYENIKQTVKKEVISSQTIVNALKADDKGKNIQ